MNKGKNIPDLDIGSVSASLAVMDEDNRIIRTAYTFYQEQINQTPADLLEDIDLSQITSDRQKE